MKLLEVALWVVIALVILYLLMVGTIVFISWVFDMEPVNYPWGMNPYSEWKLK